MEPIAASASGVTAWQGALTSPATHCDVSGVWQGERELREAVRTAHLAGPRTEPTCRAAVEVTAGAAPGPRPALRLMH